MQENFTQAKHLIERSTTILLTTHERTDGDDLGTVLALWHELRRQGKFAHVSVTGGVPKALKFLPGSHLVTEHVPNQAFDLIIISGCSQKQRIGNEAITNLKAPILNIDHHPDNSLFGDINIVNPEKSAVAELAYDFFKHSGFVVSHEVAMCLLTGIFTDTGSFMHSNTRASTLKASAELMRKGAHIARIAKHTYKGKSVDALSAWSKALANTRYSPEQKMIYSILTEKDLEELGNPKIDAFEGFVETLNKVPEANFAMFLKQDGNVIKGSLRSDPHKKVDVGKLARSLGGGGHMWASGFSIFGKLVKDDSGKWRVVN